MLDVIEHTRAAANALQRAYALARTDQVVVHSLDIDRDSDNPGWVFDFRDDDRNVVVTWLDGSALLARAISWPAVLEHANAGHRTSPDGLGDPTGCTLCRDGQLPPGITDTSFTHPEYVAPKPADDEQPEG